MAAFRFASMLLLLLAAIALATDASRLGTTGTIWTPANKHWAELFPNSYAASRKSVQAVNPALWEWGVAMPLRLPAWVLLGALGGLLGYIGRNRRRINIFTN